jgi:RNA polymerase sigma-70 factor (ECF subfamily)
MEGVEGVHARAPGEAVAQQVEVSFEELFEREHARLFRALYLITGSAQEAEELTQDAFLRVWERWERVRVMDNPGGYLSRVAVNAGRSRIRRLAVAARRTLTPGEPEDPFSAADLRDALVRALAELPERQRAALVLTELMDLPSEEAATALGITSSSVRSLVSQARRALRASMEVDHA